MQSFTVHLPDASRRDPAMLEKAEFVPDGFAYGAFVFGGFWLLFNRLWVALALYLVALAAMAGLTYGLRLDALTTLGLSTLFHLFLGIEGNHIHRLSLERAGRPAVEVVMAKRLDEAEAKFFADAVRQRPPAEAPAAGMAPAARQTAILGMFPEPGGRA